MLQKPISVGIHTDVWTFMIISGGDDNNLYDWTSSATDTGRMRICPAGTWARQSGCLGTFGNISQLWSIRTPSREQAFEKLSARRLTYRPDDQWIQAFHKATLWCWRFCVVLNRLVRQTTEKPLCFLVCCWCWVWTRQQVHTLVFGLFCPCCWSECSGGSIYMVAVLIHFYADDDVLYDVAVSKNAVTDPTETLSVRLQNIL